MQHQIGDRVTVIDPETRVKYMGRVCDLDEKDVGVCVMTRGSRVWVSGRFVGRVDA